MVSVQSCDNEWLPILYIMARIDLRPRPRTPQTRLGCQRQLTSPKHPSQHIYIYTYTPTLGRTSTRHRYSKCRMTTAPRSQQGCLCQGNKLPPSPYTNMTTITQKEAVLFFTKAHLKRQPWFSEPPLEQSARQVRSRSMRRKPLPKTRRGCSGPKHPGLSLK